MKGGAHRRILGLLGFSGALHAGAFLVYGYVYPTPPPQAVVAAPVIQLQLQPELTSELPPELPEETASGVSDKDAGKAADIVVTTSLQARSSIPTRPDEEVPPSPSNAAPVSESAAALPVAVTPTIDRILDAEPEPEQSAAQPKPRARVVSEVILEERVEKRVEEKVVTAVLSEDSAGDASAVATQGAELSGAESLAAADSGAADASRAGAAEQASDSAQLADARSRLGEQLLLALESYFSYPLKARHKGWQGEVRLRVDIDSNGQVAAVRLASSSGYGVLDRAALKSMKQVAEIDPARLQLTLTGQPLEVEIPVAYRLVN
ncbi:MAG: protein TonB [Motiliproteus sp.]|jgi:protein TonB